MGMRGSMKRILLLGLCALTCAAQELRVYAIDVEGGGALAAEYLLKLGHRKIAHLTGPRHHGNMTERAKGFVDRLAAARKPGRPESSASHCGCAGPAGGV